MKKKVAFYVNGLYGGGAEKVLQTLLRFLDYNKFEVTLYSVLQEKAGDEYPTNIDYKYIYGSTEGKSFVSRLLTLCRNRFGLWIYDHCSPSLFYRLFVNGQYDVEVAFIEGYATRIVSGSTNPDSKKIAWVHIDLDSNHWTDICYHSFDEEKRCYLQFDHVVAVSEFVRKVNERIFPGIKGSCTLYNPIDSAEIIQKSKEVIFEPHETIRLVSSGRFTHQKAFDRLLRIVKRLKDEHYPVELWLLGDGILRSELETFISENGMEDYVSLLGFQSNPYKYLNACDLFVCSSIAEGFSTVITEALILGLPVVSTEVSGVREQLGKNCEYGLITENSEIALFEGVKQLLDNQEQFLYYQKMASNRGKQFEINSLMAEIENKL
ncbi:MAG: glycosyltransferase [Prevotellaceae bacterium]|nr:glycosyltransferase [Candidatus Minthosoma equi]